MPAPAKAAGTKAGRTAPRKPVSTTLISTSISTFASGGSVSPCDARWILPGASRERHAHAASAGLTRLAISAPFSRSPPPVVVRPRKPQQDRAVVAKVAPQPHRRIGRDRAAKVEDIGDPAGGYADIERQPVGAELAGRQLALQQAAWVYGGSHDVQPLW